MAAQRPTGGGGRRQSLGTAVWTGCNWSATNLCGYYFPLNSVGFDEEV